MVIQIYFIAELSLIYIMTFWGRAITFVLHYIYMRCLNAQESWLHCIDFLRRFDIEDNDEYHDECIIVLLDNGLYYSHAACKMYVKRAMQNFFKYQRCDLNLILQLDEGFLLIWRHIDKHPWTRFFPSLWIPRGL